MRIGLVSCAKMKLRGVHESRRIYISPLFRKALASASASCDRVFILSAKHGLLDPETRIRDYNITLNEFSKAQRERWSKRVLQQLKGKVLPGDELYFFCGKRYREELIAVLRDTHPCVVPLQGMSIGEQLRWHNTKTSA